MLSSLPTDLVTVKWKVCLTALITFFREDAVVRQNQLILPNFWRVKFLDFPLHSLLSLMIHLTKKRLGLEQENLVWWSASTRIISVRGESRLSVRNVNFTTGVQISVSFKDHFMLILYVNFTIAYSYMVVLSSTKRKRVSRYFSNYIRISFIKQTPSLYLFIYLFMNVYPG